MVTYSKYVTDSDELYVRCNFLGDKYKVIFLTVDKCYDSEEYSLEIRFTDRPCAYNESSEKEFNIMFNKAIKLLNDRD